ncbi:MAG: hypothetical protein CVV44_08300 [Spirochaetae bacterium HGW-Spirochaetae-1]|jgi:hypothetical protein|nr:MAG: hypothetical protein CVV44_08300 [Spirochaetae bacterium HGW-Spirochaetae-1]
MFREFEIAGDFNKQHYKKIGILVVRMGNQVYSGVSHITLQTNYANRTCKSQSTMGISEDFVDVYIDDDTRIKESIPDYPRYKPASLSNLGAVRKEENNYYRNITPQLTKGLVHFMSKKGYEAVDVRALAKKWDRSLSEMTVQEILDRVKGNVDSLLVFHYMDIGDTYLYIVTSESRVTGFSSISYTTAMFDAKTGQRQLFFKPLFPYVIPTVLANDPLIQNDPAQRDKVSIEEGVGSSGVSTYPTKTIRVTLSDEEMIQHVIRYICYGIKFRAKDAQYDTEWKGLDMMIP